MNRCPVSGFEDEAENERFRADAVAKLSDRSRPDLDVPDYKKLS